MRLVVRNSAKRAFSVSKEKSDGVGHDKRFRDTEGDWKSVA